MTLSNILKKHKSSSSSEKGSGIVDAAVSKDENWREKRPRFSRGSEPLGFYDNNPHSSTVPMPEKGRWKREFIIHFMGGAIGGTVGTAFTCPLEVIKTRMQSAHGLDAYRKLRNRPDLATAVAGPSNSETARLLRPKHYRFTTSPWLRRHWPPLSFLALKEVWNEGKVKALFKGLVPNLIGVTPSKAIYFCTYSVMKNLWNNMLPPDSGWVHMISAGGAGLVAATCVNPIWVVKTRLQLNHGQMNARECVKRIWRRDGILGFFRGLSGSCLGISETIIQFVLYEYFRSIISDPDAKFLGLLSADKQHKTFAQFMLAGGIAKTIAVVMAYPHEVIRTRLREESNTLNFRQTLKNLWKNDKLGFYRGLSVQLLRSVPNTALTMVTYELVVYTLHNAFGGPTQNGNGN